MGFAEETPAWKDDWDVPQGAEQLPPCIEQPASFRAKFGIGIFSLWSTNTDRAECGRMIRIESRVRSFALAS